ncbi:WD40 repeat domain-containing protein [Cyanobium sp. HWJ4-Hawea]|uniref:WD40 repeat domain-containing protein n=1 Tax=unclassified Cyanobium TaxID=2627006 RepID=UPI0020CFB2F4|nr:MULTISPECIES: WD40 repeat domain-containing protein [unclassified Cyanobium]MCP9775898.1 WD40 repeat domain-containing protein [Cyanobium sp. WAJ14-Wanaka]MCP9808762.1 WD40 repeat domain-containing protein [Cyanobium sp. HWJ4-Hawea]
MNKFPKRFMLLVLSIATSSDVCLAQQNSTLTQRQSFQAHSLKGESLIQVQYSPTSEVFITTASDGTAKVWAKPGLQIKQFNQDPPAMLFNGRLEPDKSTILTAAYNGQATRWSIKGAEPKIYQPHLSGVTDVELLPEREGLVTTSDDGWIRFWSNGGQLKKRIAQPGVSRHLAIANGRKIVASTQDISTVTLMSTSGEVLQIFETNQGRLNDVIFSPNEQLVITTGFDGTIKVWELQDSRNAPILKTIIKASQTGWINGIALNKAGVLASVGDDGTVRLWSLEGKELAKIKLTQKHILSCSFSPDGKKLLVAIQDGTITEFEI